MTLSRKALPAFANLCSNTTTAVANAIPMTLT
ncbi:hypothetical protein COLO4_29375 [Corchorus olitorius]|uniref:Uncharacterized protein n=1 Tax=Corchorus olitorius TaxID=93759 RepID=A0A1R3HF26_9ROSI|nr:hypothetical protein COLO4_29375 [Corchorus olitorius]